MPQSLIPNEKFVGTSTTGDFRTDVALGLIPGLANVPFIVGMSPAVINTAFEDIWDNAGLFSWPTSAESWEIVSDDANDTSAGTGARTVLVQSLDASYVRQSQVVTLNGTTPVALTGTHIRTEKTTVITAGSSEVNAGNLTLRIVSAGLTRQLVLPGNSISFSSFYTVPAGKKGLIYQTFGGNPKGEDATIRTVFRVFGSDPVIVIGGETPVYQNTTRFPINNLGVFPEKSDFWFQAKSTNPSIEVITTLEIKEITLATFPATTIL